jgi:hypothetical protein
MSLGVQALKSAVHNGEALPTWVYILCCTRRQNVLSARRPHMYINYYDVLLEEQKLNEYLQNSVVELLFSNSEKKYHRPKWLKRKSKY